MSLCLMFLVLLRWSPHDPRYALMMLVCWPNNLMIRSGLNKTSTLIEFNPYCFGKIVDHLRLKRLHSLGFIANEPTLLPKVRDSQKKTFEKCVDYYFPGDEASKSIMG